MSEFIGDWTTRPIDGPGSPWDDDDSDDDEDDEEDNCNRNPFALEWDDPDR